MTQAPVRCGLSGCGHAKLWQVLALAFGFLGVAAGALGAHATSDDHARQIVENAAIYQLIHALLLLYAAPLTGLAAQLGKTALLLGIVLFSGGLTLKYAAGLEQLGGLAPLGGGCLMLGWLALAFSAMLDKNATRA